MNSRLDSLNLVSPPSDAGLSQNYLLDLSAPLSSDELAKQLEAWTTVSFGPEHSSVDSHLKRDFSEKPRQRAFDGGDQLSQHHHQSPYVFNPDTGVPDFRFGPSHAAGIAPDGSRLLSTPFSLPNGFVNPPPTTTPTSSSYPLPSAPSLNNSATSPYQSQSVSPSAHTSSTPSNTANNNNKRKRTSKRALKSEENPSDASPESEHPHLQQLTNDDSLDRDHKLIEEDRRRRNTQASARFRVKKKQREQALAKHAEELSGRVEELEKTVAALQQENTWLRSLITDSAFSSSSKKRSLESIDDAIGQSS